MFLKKFCIFAVNKKTINNVKKVSITLLMCILNLATIGQVTDAINQCGVDGDA